MAAPRTLAGNFVDPGIPAGYAPFNIQDIDGNLYVTYALKNATVTRMLRGPATVS